MNPELPKRGRPRGRKDAAPRTPGSYWAIEYPGVPLTNLTRSAALTSYFCSQLTGLLCKKNSWELAPTSLSTLKGSTLPALPSSGHSDQPWRCAKVGGVASEWLAAWICCDASAPYAVLLPGKNAPSGNRDERDRLAAWQVADKLRRSIAFLRSQTELFAKASIRALVNGDSEAFESVSLVAKPATSKSSKRYRNGAAITAKILDATDTEELAQADAEEKQLADEAKQQGQKWNGIVIGSSRDRRRMKKAAHQLAVSLPNWALRSYHRFHPHVLPIGVSAPSLPADAIAERVYGGDRKALSLGNNIPGGRKKLQELRRKSVIIYQADGPLIAFGKSQGLTK